MGKFGDVSENRRNLWLSAAALTALTVSLLFGRADAAPTRTRSAEQSIAATAPDYGYDVISVKPNKSGDTRIRLESPPDGLAAINVLPIMLFGMAYRDKWLVRPEQVLGLPAWFDSERFDVKAKMDGAVADRVAKLSPEQSALARQHMLQALLADRFQLIVHFETRELPVFLLVVAKNGPKLKEATPGDTYPNGIKMPNGATGPSMMSLPTKTGATAVTAQGVPIELLVGMLSGQAGRTILDRTGLNGKYDFTLEYAPMTGPQPGALSPSSDPDGPSLFAAIQEQLGLKLESGKGPVRVIVVDHVERPSGN